MGKNVVKIADFLNNLYAPRGSGNAPKKLNHLVIKG